MANAVFDQLSFSQQPMHQQSTLKPKNGRCDHSSVSNARFGEVILLDGRRVEIKIQPRLFAGDLFDMVASHFNLKEKEYFGLAFLDETGQYSWLNLEKRVLEHEYAQNSRTKTSSVQSSKSLNFKKKEEDDAIFTVSTSKSVSSVKENSRPVHNRRIGDLKRKKGSNTHQIPSSKTPLSKKGSLSNLSGSLRAKLQNGANGMLSRLMSSTTSLPTAAASSSNSILSNSTTNSTENSTSTFPARGGGSDNYHFKHHQHHSLSSAHSLELNHHEKGGIDSCSSSTILNSTTDDPLYDVINEESGNSDNCCEVNSVFMVEDNSNNQAYHHFFAATSSVTDLDLRMDCHGSAFHKDFLKSEHNEQTEERLNEMGELEEEEDDDSRLVLYFLVKYFVESISMLADTTTIELFFLQAKALLINETVQVLDLDTNLTLLALVLQSLYGDISSDSKARHRIHKQQLISSYLLQELDTSSTCEDRIIEEYRSLAGTSRAQAIHRFMTLIEKQPTYGVHFYEVKDKSGAPYWLGLSGRGISQFDYEDRRLPKRQFPWKQLENLYFREKKFSIEVRDPKRVVHTLSSINLYENAIEDVDFDDLSSAICDPTTQVSVSRRTFGPCNVTVYVWFSASSSLTKCIWSMAISQHQFYIDRRVTKCHIVCNRSAEEIIASLSANDDASSITAKSVQSSLKNTPKSKKRYSITTTTSSASNSTSATSRNRHHLLSNGSLGLSRRFSSLGSIHSRTPSSDSSSVSAVSSTRSLHSLDSPTATSSLISSPPSALSLRGPNEGGDNHSNHHLWDATSDSASLFGGASSSFSSSSGALNHYQQANFRHLQSSNSSRMSRSTSARSGSKSLCFRRLRLLETQLSAKLEEVKRLDALEQQILQRAAKAALPPEQVPAMNSTTSSPGSHHLHNSSSSSSSDQSLSSASSTCSASGTSLATIGSGNTNNTGRAHYRSALFSQPTSSNHQSKLSLKNFVVTGRNGGQQTNTTASTTLSSTDGGDGSLNKEIQPQHLRYNSVLSEQHSNTSAINHQRSRSVGLRHSSNSNSNYSNSLDRKQRGKAQLLPPPQSSASQTETLKSIVNSSSSNAIPNSPSSNVQPRQTTTLLPSNDQISQLPSFTSPYVNKFDTSVQSLLVGGSTNLYSVPNRRTSIALNSFDDSFLTLGNKQSSTIATNQVNNNIRPQNKTLDQNSNVGKGGSSGAGAGKFLYQFTTTAVTSSVNSVTLSTMSYCYEQRILPTSSSKITTSSSVIGGFNQNQQTNPPNSENVYATIGPGSSNSSDSASLISSAADHQNYHNYSHQPLHHHYHQQQQAQNLISSQHLLQQNPQPQHNFFESSVDELDSLPPAPAPPSEAELLRRYHQHQHNNNAYYMISPQLGTRNSRQQQAGQRLPSQLSIDEENLTNYKNVLLTRSNSFGNEGGNDQQQLVRPPGYYHSHHYQKPVQSLQRQQQQQQQQSSPYTAQIRAQTESLYANYANIGANYPSSGTLRSSGQHSLVSQQPQPQQQHHYQNAQSLILTHQLQLHNPQHQQLNLQLPSPRSSPVSQPGSPSRHIYQSVSPLPPPPPPSQPSTTTPYISSSASLPTKKPPKTWFDSDLDFPTGNIRTTAKNLPVVGSSRKYANDDIEKKPKQSFAEPRDSSVDHHDHDPVVDHQLPSPFIHVQQKMQQPSLLATLSSGSKTNIPSSATSTYTNSLYLQTPVSTVISNDSNISKSFKHITGNPSFRTSANASPTPSNSSSVSSSASTFIQHTVSSSSSSDGSNTFIINRSPTNDGASSSNGGSALLTPTGSVISLQSAISGSSISTNNVIQQYPVATVAFVPSMAGQDAVSITATAGSSSLSPSSSSSTTSAVGGNRNYHQQTVHHSGSSMPLSPTSVPIASCKGNIVEVDVVTVGQCQPGYEEEKPFTISDYYKYSEKYRKAKAAAAAAAAKFEPGGNTAVSERGSISSVITTATYTTSSEPILTVPKMESTSQLISRLEGLNLHPQQPVNNGSSNTPDSFFASAAQVVQTGASVRTLNGHQNQNQSYYQQPQHFQSFHDHHSVFNPLSSAISMMATMPTTAPAVDTVAGSTNSDDNNNLPVY